MFKFKTYKIFTAILNTGTVEQVGIELSLTHLASVLLHHFLNFVLPPEVKKIFLKKYSEFRMDFSDSSHTTTMESLTHYTLYTICYSRYIWQIISTQYLHPHLTCGGWQVSVSSLLLLHMLVAVCLTSGPTARLEITMPSTRGVARCILDNGSYRCDNI